MVRIDDFHIEFDQKWSVYHPGERVTGVVRLRLNDKIFADSVTANFYGTARVFWTTREISKTKNGDAFLNVAYTSEKAYFNEKCDLWFFAQPPAGDGTGKKAPTKTTLVDVRPHLAQGAHVFNFDFLLPADLPTSFDAKYANGYIRYSVKICLMQEETIKHSRKAYFTVVKPRDLNVFSPASVYPVDKEALQTLAGGCCFKSALKNGELRLRARLPKSAFVPGEPIMADVEVENQTETSVKMLKMHLMQRIACYAEKPVFRAKTSSHSVSAIGKREKIRCGCTYNWTGEPLYIPAVVPTFDEVDLIAVSYSLVVEAYIDNVSPMLTVELPLVIGTVPLRDGLRPVHGIENINEAPPAYENVIGMAPPSYEESIAGTNGNDQENFIPKYVVYRFQK